jgi:hypothetical protein
VRPRLLFTVASAAALLATAVASGQPAGAVPDCAIRDFSPHEIVLGGRTSNTVHFELDTSCPVDADVSWYVTVHAGAPGPYGWLMRANFWQFPGSRFQWIPDGTARLPFVSEGLVGANQIRFDAFLGDIHAPTRAMTLSSTIDVKRGTTFDGRPAAGDHFRAVPDTAAPGDTLTLTGVLERADLAAGEYDPDLVGFAAPVVVQFRGDGNSKYADVKTVQSAADGSVTTTVTAKRSGTWRLRYAGDATNAATKSLESHVTVVR